MERPRAGSGLLGTARRAQRDAAGLVRSLHHAGQELALDLADLTFCDSGGVNLFLRLDCQVPLRVTMSATLAVTTAVTTVVA